MRQQDSACMSLRKNSIAGGSEPGLIPQGSDGITCPIKYKTAGDVSTNSPGNWNDINNNKNTFNSNPVANHWVGQTTNTCVAPHQTFNPGPDANVNLGRNLLHTAFYTLVANDTATGSNVRNELLSLAAEPGLNFGNTARWCPTGNTNDQNPYFMIAIWSHQMLFAYDYQRRTWRTAPRSFRPRTRPPSTAGSRAWAVTGGGWAAEVAASIT